ncbi:DNA mismatch repair protein [Pedobacter hiemivivus]|uniref:DNA mismatch repair protein n=1 Tax=Pedobacter hiemivivus TaxID=2530454 RepID=A0A4U1GR25_9SPHI|nr:DNA mismatch repair protein [Pedobacter hiemivivus]TKC65663.1 DNA mismatch repair protein [Pedobacter hiemivivus]
MSFTIDKQTLDDLAIFSHRGKKSIYDLFNRAATIGGAAQLDQMFRYPLSDMGQINRRSAILRELHQYHIKFPFRVELFDIAELYLKNTDTRSQLTKEQNNLKHKFNQVIGGDTHFQSVSNGVTAILEILIAIIDFISNSNLPAESKARAFFLDDFYESVKELSENEILKTRKIKSLSFEIVVDLDKQFRYRLNDKLRKLINHIYTLDAFLAVAETAQRNNFAFPVATTGDKYEITIKELYHPLLKNPVANNITVDPEGNIIFLTGANMAGKSTFMKSFGIAIFLAHMGFPIPATHMEFSVCDGLLTTINLPDNINMGYSHFYSEVLRVKQMAEQIRLGKKIVIIFDELFRGTNVKDAYEATVAIASGFAKIPKSIFIVSTHIIEAGEKLRGMHENINFIYLPTHMQGDKPSYTYKIEKGISDDRHGMIIIRNERILDILEKGPTKPHHK